MGSKRLLAVLSVLSLILVVLLACASGAPAPTAKPASPTAAPPTTSAKTTPATTPAAKPTTSPAATAKPAAAGVSFAGKTITVITPYSPGGGTDLAARLYAKWFGKYLPGNPAMVVRNIPGGEAIFGSNAAYAAKPDGLTLLAAGGSVFMGELLDKPAKKYSMTKMPAIIGLPLSSAMITRPSVIKNADDIMNAKGMVWGHTAGGVSVIFIISRELIGFPLEKAIMAYSSSGDSLRAFMSGETNAVNATAGLYKSTIKPMEDKGEVILMFQTGSLEASGQLRQSPVFAKTVLTAAGAYEKMYNKPPSGNAWEAYKSIAATRSADKPLLLPPGTPQNIVDTYWAAAEKLVKDPEFLKTTDELYAENEWIVGKEFDDLFKGQVKMSPDTRKWLSNLLESKYGAVLE